MTGVLHIREAVVTEACLTQQHRGETELHVLRRATITPSGWDFIRHHRLHVTKVEQAAMGVVAPVQPPSAGSPQGIGERRSSAGDSSLLQQGRCEFPDRSYGCKTEEFGSGFVEPSSCYDCALLSERQSAGGKRVCQGCNRYRTQEQVMGAGSADVEVLVKRITDEIMTLLDR